MRHETRHRQAIQQRQTRPRQGSEPKPRQRQQCRDRKRARNELQDPSRTITSPDGGRSQEARHTMNPPVRLSGKRSGSRTLGKGTRRPGWPPTAPSGGRLWHGSAVRRPHLGGGGEALTFGRLGDHRRHLGSHPIHRDLWSDGRGMRRKAPAIGFFTERTLAAYLAVSDRTIRNWIRRGELPSYKLGASRRIDPADVDDFLARHRDEAA